MSAGVETVTNVEVALTQIQGTLERIFDAQKRVEEDVRDIKGKYHVVNNELTKLQALNIQERFASVNVKIGEIDASFGAKLVAADLKAEATKTAIEARLDKCEAERDQRTGAMAAMKLMYTLAGGLGAGGIVAIVKILGG